MSNDIPEYVRPRFDSPRPGYKRHTIFINVDLLWRCKTVCSREKITFTTLLEEALRNRIDFQGKLKQS